MIMKREEIKSNYKQRLTMILKENHGIMDTQEKWENILTCIHVVAKEAICEKEVLVKHNNWYDEECRKTQEERNEARKMMLQRRKRAIVEYQNKRRCVQNICRRKKRLLENEKIREIEL